jgi:ABC-type iron transport system FetAB permease component
MDISDSGNRCVVVYDALTSITLASLSFFAAQTRVKVQARRIIPLEKMITGNAISWYSFS